ncbi:hypothetical protein evm_011453 [Chilo suppressalis]|nr:hypothetical protein evm_011453 [Chilo suppressalis]
MQLPKHLKIGAGTAAAGVFGIIFGWVLFPAILKSQLKKEMALSKKTDVRGMWEKIPFALSFKVFLFNYTNVEEIQKGGVPIVKEIGPYHFDEWKEKLEVEDHEEDDTITYKKRDVFYFRPELSGPGLTGEEIITMPHILMVSIATVVNKEKPAMLNMIGKAFNGIFDGPQHVFMNVKALDIMFRGTIINCARTEFAPKAVCTAIKKEASGLIIEPNNQFRFSLFGMRNDTIDPHVITVKRGIKNVMDVGQVVAVDGNPEQSIWRDSCNMYEGTDGTVFPPFLTENDRLESFSTDMCRIDQNPFLADAYVITSTCMPNFSPIRPVVWAGDHYADERMGHTDVKWPPSPMDISNASATSMPLPFMEHTFEASLEEDHFIVLREHHGAHPMDLEIPPLWI